MKPIISIVIPLYNCGEYISRCLDSILRQGLNPDEYEVIIVNDGSSDSGPEIASEYCCKYSNFKLHQQSNQGVSAARNLGLRYASGDWIHFFDADDFIIDGGYRSILNEMGGGDYQVVKFSSKTIYEGDDINNYNNQAQSSIIFNGNASEYVKKFGFNGAVITSLYKHDFLTEHNLIFEKFSYREDLLFNIRCFTVPQARVMYTSNILYGYFVRHNSASRLLTKDRLLRAIKDFCGINKILSEDIIPRLSQLSDIVIGYSISIQKEAFLKLFHDRNLSLSELKELLRQQYITYLFPITSDNRLDAAKNWLLSHPVFFKTASWLYSKLR